MKGGVKVQYCKGTAASFSIIDIFIYRSISFSFFFLNGFQTAFFNLCSTTELFLFCTAQLF